MPRTALRPALRRSAGLGLALLALLGAGCGAAGPTSGPAAFDGAALLTLATTDGALGVELRTSPQPPERGLDSAEFRIAGPTGAAVDGLSLAVLPWMPDMGHGTSLRPVVTAQGGGVYLVDNLSLFMAGRWQLRTTISGAASGSVVPEFEIQ